MVLSRGAAAVNSPGASAPGMRTSRLSPEPRRGGRGRVFCHPFGVHVVAAFVPGLTPPAIDCRPFGTYANNARSSILFCALLRPIVRAERRGGQAGLVVQVAVGVVGPGVAHGRRASATSGLETTTVSPSILASAQTNFLSSPAMAKPLSCRRPWPPGRRRRGRTAATILPPSLAHRLVERARRRRRPCRRSWPGPTGPAACRRPACSSGGCRWPRRCRWSRPCRCSACASVLRNCLADQRPAAGLRRAAAAAAMKLGSCTKRRGSRPAPRSLRQLAIMVAQLQAVELARAGVRLRPGTRSRRGWRRGPAGRSCRCRARPGGAATVRDLRRLRACAAAGLPAGLGLGRRLLPLGQLLLVLLLGLLGVVARRSPSRTPRASASARARASWAFDAGPGLDRRAAPRRVDQADRHVQLLVQLAAEEVGRGREAADRLRAADLPLARRSRPAAPRPSCGRR